MRCKSPAHCQIFSFFHMFKMLYMICVVFVFKLEEIYTNKGQFSFSFSQQVSLLLFRWYLYNYHYSIVTLRKFTQFHECRGRKSLSSLSLTLIYVKRQESLDQCPMLIMPISTDQALIRNIPEKNWSALICIQWAILICIDRHWTLIEVVLERGRGDWKNGENLKKLDWFIQL